MHFVRGYLRRKNGDTHAIEKLIDNGRLEYEAQWDPVQEAQQRLESSLDQGALPSFLQHFRAEFEDLGELSTHLVLEVFYFGLRHLFCRKVEDLF